MNKMSINWGRKLSSRKFWLALVGFITPILYLLNMAESDVEAIVSIIMAGATLIAYIFAEGFVDANSPGEIQVVEVERLEEGE